MKYRWFPAPVKHITLRYYCPSDFLHALLVLYLCSHRVEFVLLVCEHSALATIIVSQHVVMWFCLSFCLQLVLVFQSTDFQETWYVESMRQCKGKGLYMTRWRHNGVMSWFFFKMHLLRQLLSELDEILTQCSSVWRINYPWGPRPVVLIVYTGHATRRHFVLLRLRGLSRRTLKTITHHTSLTTTHTERSVYQVRALSPA